MNRLAHWAAVTATALSLVGLGGCTTASLLLSAAGVASDTSMTWDIAKHLYAKLTEGEPPLCSSLDSVERAISPRCGAFVRGSLRARDLAASPFGPCALTIAARDPRLWPALPELLDNGARPQTCTQSPIVALAQANDCPGLAATTQDQRDALTTLTQIDPRSLQPDVVRWLSCPASREAGLDATLVTWLDTGALNPGRVGFNPLAALHPSDLGSAFSDALEACGHGVETAFDGYARPRPVGFEEALRGSDLKALEWWLARRPQLANRVPGPQLDWVPLARVLNPGFLSAPAGQAEMVDFLLAHGADPRMRLPTNPSQSVVDLARTMRSPVLAALESAPSGGSMAGANLVVANSRALRLIAE